MIVVNLERYTDDGYKTSANSLNASAPDNITHARFYYDDFTGSNYLQATFVSGENSTVQADNAGVIFDKFKLYTSADGVNYTERKSYGGDTGKTVPIIGTSLDPADFADNDLIRKTTVDSVEIFEPISLQDLANEIGLTIPGGADGTYIITVDLWTDDGITLESSILNNNTGVPLIDGAGLDNHYFYTLGEFGVDDGFTSKWAVAPLYTIYLNEDPQFVTPEIKGYILLSAALSVVSIDGYELGITISVTDLSFGNGISIMEIGKKYIFKFNVLLTTD